MRKSLIIVFVLFIFLNANAQQSSIAVKKTTLDSLQGRWFSEAMIKRVN